jgi:hypothetical protein
VPYPLRLRAATAVAAAALTVALSGVTATAATNQAAAAPRAGLTAGPITLASNTDLTGGDDAVMDASGTAYIGWIGNINSAGRTVFLCVLPPGATACKAGIQSTPSLGTSSAAGLQMLVAGGKVTLVWFHDTNKSVSGPENAKIATATVTNGVLSAAHDQGPAPSFGILEDAAVGPGGTVWAVTTRSGSQNVQVTPGLGNKPVTVPTPYLISSENGAQLAFSGATPIMVIDMGGAISQPVSYAAEKNGKWPAFKPVANTWTGAANFGLATTTSGVRLLATIDNANYWPVVSKWTGSSFSPRQLTGDKAPCTPNSHDPVADASGRMTDIYGNCGETVAVANLTDTLHAAVVRFASGGTLAGPNPQIATSPRGHAWAVWSIEASVSDNLFAVPMLLPGRDVTAKATSTKGNEADLKGPDSCLPPVSIPVKVTGVPAAHWKVTSSTLALDGKTITGKTLDGSTLTAGKSYTLTGQVSFADGGSKDSATATLKFRSCPKP